MAPFDVYLDEVGEQCGPGSWSAVSLFQRGVPNGLDPNSLQIWRCRPDVEDLSTATVLRLNRSSRDRILILGDRNGQLPPPRNLGGVPFPSNNKKIELDRPTLNE